MRKLSKLDAIKKKALIVHLRLLSMEEENFNAEKYNEIVSNLNNFIIEQRDEMQMYFDERSEKWQESDAGSSYQDWIDAWDLEIGEVEDFDDVEIPDESELPDEPD